MCIGVQIETVWELRIRFGSAVLSAVLGVALAASIALGAVEPETETLRIDFQAFGGPIPPGHQAYEAVNQNPGTLGPRNYLGAFPATVDLVVENLPDGASDFRVVTRSASAPSDVIDWIGVDARLGPLGSPTAGNPRPSMDVIVTNLPDGKYEWSSLHHDTLNQTGIVSYIFSHALGGSSGLIDISAGSEPMTTFDTMFESRNGGPISLKMIVTARDGTATFAVTTSFALINSLQLTRLPTVIPEPSATVILAFSVCGAASIRKWCAASRRKAN